MKSYDTPPLVVSSPDENITDLLIHRLNETPNDALFALDNGDGTWGNVTTREFYNRVVAVAKGLVAAGMQPGQMVAIMSRTRFEWTLVDFAIWFAGGVPVPIYETSAPSQMEWILSDSDAVMLFVESSEHMERFEQIKAATPLVRNVYSFEDDSLDKLVELGREVSSDTIEMRRKSAKLSDLSTLIYTSGTTGKPKGCELTHRGFVELCKNATLELPEVVYPGANMLLFIPLAHVFARFIEVLCVYAGVRVGHQPNAKNIAPAMVSFKPNFLLAVPRVFEKVYNSAEQKAEAAGKGKIFRKAAYTAIAYSRALDTAKGPSIGLTIQHKLFDVLVYKKLRAAMGGDVKFAVSGGAPLGSRLGHFFRAIGMVVLEGYGLTETTAPASIGRPNNVKIGKVGTMLPGNGVKIADDGEILLRGVNILRGYWKNPEATAAAIQDGWFRSGDIGEIDEDGFLSITGRKKELIVTAGGKNVAPTALEDPLRANPLIGQAVVIGDQKPFVAALISLDTEMLPIWLANNGADKTMSLSDAAKSPLVLAEVQIAVDRVNKHFSKAESIRKFVIIDRELTEESGHLTPSLKVKRDVVIRDFAPAVEEIYETGPMTGPSEKF